MARRFRMQFQDVRPSIRATRPVTQVPRFSALFSRVPIEQAGERPSRRKLRVLESSLLPGCERRSPLLNHQGPPVLPAAISSKSVCAADNGKRVGGLRREGALRARRLLLGASETNSSESPSSSF